jgi:hypothetical protein
MKYAVEMGSVAIIYIRSFVKTGSVIQKLTGGDTQIHRQDGDGISLLQESGLKKYSQTRTHILIQNDIGLPCRRRLR